MANTQRRDDEPTRSRRVRGALAPLGRASAAATACILWVGLALPGLQLLPGASGFGDRSIAISLQSALLGIDNGYASTPEARAAMRALGLAVISQTPVPGLQTDSPVTLAVDLAESIRSDTVDTTVTPTLISDGPHNRPSAGTDSPAGTPPSHGHPAAPTEPTQPTPPPGGGATPPTAPKPPSAPTKSPQSITFTTVALGRRRRRLLRGRRFRELRSAGELLARARQLRRLHDLGRDRQLRRDRNVHRPGEPVRERELPGGAAGHAVRRRRRRGRRPDHQLSLDASLGRACPRPPVQREREGDLGAAGRARHGRRECRDLQGDRREGPSHRRGHVHDHRDPARQQQVQAGASGAAVVLDRHGCPLPERPVDQLHVDAADLAGSRGDLRHCSDRQLRADGGVLGGAVQRRGLHRRRLDGLTRRNRNLHRPCEPGGQRELPRGAAGAAGVPGRARRPDDHVLEHAAFGRCCRRSGVHRGGDVFVRPPCRLQRQPEQRLRLHRLRLDRLVDGCRDLHRRRRPARRRDARSGAAGPAVVHDRRPSRRRASSRSASPLRRPPSSVAGGAAYAVSASASSGLRGHLLGRALERRRLHRLRLDGLPRRRRYLRRACGPGGQRELPGRAAGLAVVRGRSRTADDELHVLASVERNRRRSRLRGRRLGDLRPRRRRSPPPLRAPGSAPCRARASPSSPQERAR